MGANEKHAATYHGGEYTPTPDEVREQWSYTESPRATTIAGAAAEFDRMLAKVRAEAKAEAWDEGYGDCWDYHRSDGMIGRLHNPYKENQS